MKPSVSSLVSGFHSEMYSPVRHMASEIKDKLRNVGLRPTRTRVALAYMLFAQGNRHVSAEMLFEEASRAKEGCLRRVFSLKSQAGGIAVVTPWRGSAAGGAALPAGGGAAIGSALAKPGGSL